MTIIMKRIRLAAVIAVTSVSGALAPAEAMQRDHGGRTDIKDHRDESAARRDSVVCHTETGIFTQPSYVDSNGVKHIFGPAPGTRTVCVKK